MHACKQLAPASACQYLGLSLCAYASANSQVLPDASVSATLRAGVCWRQPDPGVSLRLAVPECAGGQLPPSFAPSFHAQPELAEVHIKAKAREAPR